MLMYLPMALETKKYVVNRVWLVTNSVLNVELMAYVLGKWFSPDDRLDGLQFEIADWHAGNKFLEVFIFNLQFHSVTAYYD